MKKSLLFSLLFLKFVMYSQTYVYTNSQYRLNISGYVGLWGDDCGDSKHPGVHWVVGHYSLGGNPLSLFQASVPYPGNMDGYVNSGYGNWGGITNYTNANVISRIQILTSKREKNWVGDCRGSDYRDAWLNLNKAQDINYDLGSIGLNQPGNLRIVSIPRTDLEFFDDKNNVIGDEDELIFEEKPGGIDSNFYNWKFTTKNDLNGNPIWESFPLIYQGNKNIKIKGKDIFTNSIPPLNGSSFKIQVVNNFGYPAPNSSPNFIQLTYLKSAPHITTVVATSPRCYKESNGNVVVNFDRALLNNEILGFNLFNITTNSDQISSGALIGNPNLNLSSDRKSITIKDLPAGKYRLNLGPGGLDGVNTYIKGDKHKIEFEIAEILPVTFKLTKTDIWCHGGQDGVIKIEANGGNPLGTDSSDTSKHTKGTPRYYYSLDNGLTWKGFDTEFSHSLIKLPIGTYTIKVRDWKGCNALQPNDAILKLSETIQQPQEAVSLSYTSIKQPTFYGGTNGQLVVAIKGGTPFDDHSYAYEWKNSKGVLQTNITPYYDATAKVYYLTLTGIPSDTYTLTVRDKNYTSATDKDGCTVANSTQFLDQPDPIVVKLNVQRTISCNVTNVFGNEADLDPVDGQRDESQDGILQATVTGGVPFTGFENNGLPYKFIWRKQKSNGSWEIWNDQDATAQYLNHGNYSLNVEDKNGIRLGVYVNNVLSQETPVIQLMAQPSKLELQFLKGDISCSAGNNGWIKAVPTGGTPPYNYEWTTGATTSQISNLIANNYFVKITDAKGCFVQGSMLINQPNGVVINGIVTSPTCHDGVDGSIITTVTGGTPPYTYSWNTGGNTKDIVSLASGDYQLTVVDSKGCTYYKNFKLDNPDPIVVNLGGNRTLCNGQQLDLDISIPDPQAQYSWTSTQGFSSNSAKVSLTQAGTYTAKVISSKGCLGQDSFVLKTSNVAISSEFFLTSQAYLNDEVILIYASNPLGENTSWQIPNTVTIVNQNEKYIVLKFTSLGSYTISLKQTQGDCYALYSKTITVEPKTIDANIGNVAQPFITDFLVTPNPSNGDFQAIVKLAETSPIKLRLYPINGQQPLVEKKENGQKSYVIEFNSALPTGTYALILETAKQTLVKKIIIY